VSNHFSKEGFHEKDKSIFLTVIFVLLSVCTDQVAVFGSDVIDQPSIMIVL
jgi:hypothetical protein